MAVVSLVRSQLVHDSAVSHSVESMLAAALGLVLPASALIIEGLQVVKNSPVGLY
jgi:hypothetical protein